MLREPGKPTTSHDDTTRARREQSNHTATVTCSIDVELAQPPEARTTISETRHPDGRHREPQRVPQCEVQREP
jgi:hypothetical protein